MARILTELESLRRGAQLSRADLARLFHVSVNTLATWESGTVRAPQKRVRERIEKLFRMRWSTLMLPHDSEE